MKVELGQRDFAWGDAIEITELWATSAKLAVGDEVIVRGRYRLQSQEQAMLALFVTASGPGGSGRVSPTQRQAVERGTGEFDLSCEIRAAGKLHLSFYPTRSGSSFGGVYFSAR